MEMNESCNGCTNLETSCPPKDWSVQIASWSLQFGCPRKRTMATMLSECNLYYRGLRGIFTPQNGRWKQPKTWTKSSVTSKVREIVYNSRYAMMDNFLPIHPLTGILTIQSATFFFIQLNFLMPSIFSFFLFVLGVGWCFLLDCFPLVDPWVFTVTAPIPNWDRTFSWLKCVNGKQYMFQNV